ncbi:MAG: MATE family efflux transporter [Candidatus Sumerlaeia bacterium]|nr:MATE family efflux transporter [Candidatus Sumerlaeia bacterium]
MRPTLEGPAGFRELLAVAWPLMISQAIHAVNLFLDRVFLARYDGVHFAAASPAGVTWWMSISLGMGLVGYVSTFVAQYNGAGRGQRMGAALWQAIHLGVLFAAASLVLTFVSGPFFQWVGHEGGQPALQAAYFNVLCYGTLAAMLNAALSGYFTGQGRTRFVLAVNSVSAVVNALLNWWFIFHGGPFDLVEKGIVGAAWATVLGTMASTAIFLWFALRARERRSHGTGAWAIDPDLMRRMVRFGLPSGFHMLVDMIAFNVFFLVVGKFGLVAQIASSMAMTINMLFFVPAMGLHQAVQVLTGKFLAAGRREEAEQATGNATILSVSYFAAFTVAVVAAPGLFLGAYGTVELDNPALAAEVDRLGRLLLLVVALYSLFDGVCLVLAGALKGAGDTKWVMWVSLGLSQALLTLPCLALWWFSATLDPRTGVMLCWGALWLYICVITAFYIGRYRGGRWMDMRVIEEAPPLISLEETPRLAPARERAEASPA